MTEVVSVLRVLARRRIAIAAGAIAAVAAGLALAGELPLGPAVAVPRPSVVASARVLVDTHRSMVGDLNGGTEAIGEQATLLAELLADDAQVASIAWVAGVASASLDVRVAARPSAGTPGTLASKIVEATATSGRPYVVTVEPYPSVSIIAIETRAPDVGTATRLARATSGVLAQLVAARAPARWRSLVAEPLGTVRSLEIAGSSRRGPLLGFVAAFVLFALWCCALVVATGLGRLWRATPVAP
jgi:hypothetical protein